MNTALQALTDAGVSIWLDDLSRTRIESGNLAQLVANSGVVGVTTNPTIFASALSNSERYTPQIAELKANGADLNQVVFELTCTDVQEACDILRPVYDETSGVDGRVSIEVEPALAHSTDETVAMAEKLYQRVNRPNVMIKIPATVEGLPAITQTIGRGISVNVTLIFALARYQEVIEAYVAGLELAQRNGHDLSKISSVASFFVSRVDTEIDSRLSADDPLGGKAAVANARLAYGEFVESTANDRFTALQSAGALAQRPLWASTGVKDPAYPDTLYVTELVAPQTVNTMPEKTLEAVADHGDITGDTISENLDESREVLAALSDAGISYDEVVDKLEREGLEKFEASWVELLETVQTELDKVPGESVNGTDND